MNYPTITKIIENKKENQDVKTITFRHPGKIEPGQFFMVWIPEIDEIPMSVSYISKEIKGFTYRRVGDATNALFKLKKDNKIGIRGPYGNGFDLKGNKILFVAGGTGIAMIAPTVEQAVKNNISTTVILGVKSKKELFFEKRIKDTGSKILISTDDGSKGYKGLASDLTKDILTKEKFDQVLTCGPEIMMKKLYGLCRNIPFQVSLERYMKCGFGICGQCCVGEGLRVCKEGPIFNDKQLKKIYDFGVYKRDAAGRKIKL